MDLRFVLLITASVAAGAVNALAGGGTFLVFPALLLAGVAPVTANATASFLLWPAGLASAWVYRKDIPEDRKMLGSMALVSVLGSIAGSLVLLRTSNATFSALVPWLLLFATLNFTFSKQLRNLAADASHRTSFVVLVGGQLAISFYGGYFGAGMGVLMLALYLAATSQDVHAANGLRLVCGVTINAIAILVFAAKGAIDWRIGIPTMLAALIGGYLGAVIVRRLKADSARRWIIAYAWLVTLWFFAQPLFRR